MVLRILIALLFFAAPAFSAELKNAQLEKLSADPVTNAVEARIFWDTDDNLFRVYDGSAWLSIADLTRAQTLTNKTLTSPILNSPTMTTPTLGVATATSINKMAITAPATGSTLAVADGKTATISNTLTFTGTDTSSVAFGAGGTVGYTGGKLSQFAATTSAELFGVLSDETGGSGVVVGSTSPVVTTPTVRTSLLLQNASGAQPELHLSEDPDNGTNKVQIKANATMGGDYTLTLPATDGTTGQVLVDTDGSGTLGWGSSASVPAAGAVYSDSASLLSEAQLALSRGGTNKSITPAAGGILWTDADSVEVGAAGTSGYLLRSNGTSAPSFTNAVTVSGTTTTFGGNVDAATGGGTVTTGPLSVDYVYIGRQATSNLYLADNDAGNASVGLFYAEAGTGVAHCDTICDGADTAHNWTNNSSTCLFAWNRATAAIITCGDITNISRMCMCSGATPQ